MKDVKGFTLIELMVTIAVLAIIISIAVPSYRNFIASSRLDAASSDLTSAVQFARAEALRRNAPITFCRAANATATACTAGNLWTHWVILSGNTVVRRGEINSFGNTLRVTSALTSSQMVIGGDGLARTGSNLVTETNGRIAICSTFGPAEAQRRIDIGAGSRVTSTRVAGACT